MSNGGYVLGVDGGGSKTIAWIARVAESPADQTAGPLGRGDAGPSNLLAVGPDAAFQAIEEAVGQALQMAGAHRSQLEAACLALAGAGRQEQRSTVKSWAVANVAANTQVVNDAEPVLFAANRDGVGAALIAGTGSLAIARGLDGTSSRSGGWGRVMGDEGGGYALACAALRQVARAFDSRCGSTTLTDAALSHFQADNWQQLVRTVCNATTAAIAAFAPRVIQAATDDEAARDIVEQGADELAELIVSATRRVELPSPAPLAIAGGLIVHHPAYRSLVVSHVAERGLAIREPSLIREPVAGAVVLARQAAGK